MASKPVEEHDPNQRTCLVIVAHPDDIERYCAGAVTELVRSGWRAVYVLCTSGDKGNANHGDTPAQVANRRESEQRAAARVVGAEPPIFLRFGDGELEDSRPLRATLVREVRRARPELLITHDPEHPTPPYITHRDHRIAGRVALDAAYPYARDALHFPEQLRDGSLKPHAVSEVWLFGSTQPNHFVSIAESIETKIAARLAHASQTHDEGALAEHWQQFARDAGAPVGLEFAEDFVRLMLTS